MKWVIEGIIYDGVKELWTTLTLGLLITDFNYFQCQEVSQPQEVLGLTL